MMEGAAESLIAAGPLGAIVVGMSVAYWRQAVALKQSQEARVQDAQKVTKQLLELNDKWNESVNNLTAAVNELRLVLQTRSGQ